METECCFAWITVTYPLIVVTTAKRFAVFFQTHSYDFNTQNALIQIYAYVEKYGDQILATLDSNPEARRQRLQEQLENVYMPMNGSTQP